ncbi:unnamed protein product [Hymenolepis diminuta]|uniref:Transmembrane protein n=1 Tax=Hymenolepis diminuta TaxID=6216 RepID=A0A0R3SGA2_HYMDI|nr:unnamed protein product [Hymenolepis diminuta]
MKLHEILIGSRGWTNQMPSIDELPYHKRQLLEERALKQCPLLEMNSLTAALFGLIGSAAALTLEEAMKNPKENILYDTTPYSKAWEAGLGSFVTFGSLIILITFLALGARINGTQRRRQTIM